MNGIQLEYSLEALISFTDINKPFFEQSMVGKRLSLILIYIQYKFSQYSNYATKFVYFNASKRSSFVWLKIGGLRVFPVRWWWWW